MLKRDLHATARPSRKHFRKLRRNFFDLDDTIDAFLDFGAESNDSKAS